MSYRDQGEPARAQWEYWRLVVNTVDWGTGTGRRFDLECAILGEQGWEMVNYSADDNKAGWIYEAVFKRLK